MRAIAPRVGHLLMLLLAVTGALLAGAAPASAHAALLGSDPKQGAVVETAPKQVSLTFSEDVALSDGSIRVLDPAGKRVDTGKPEDLGEDVYSVKLHSGLPDGTFTVAYQVVSADSHPVSGAFTFSVGAPSKTSVALGDETAGGGVLGGLYGVARYVSYAGFIVMVGGAAFVLACWPRGAGVRAVQRVVVSGWVALTAATLAMLLMRGAYTGSGKLADVFDLGQLGTVLQTKTGAALSSRLLLLAAAALFIAVLFGAYVRHEGDHGGEASDEGDGAGRVGATSDGDAAGQGGYDRQSETNRQSETDGRATDSQKSDLAFGLAVGGAVVAAGLAATWAMAEHASTGIQAGLAMPLDVLHLLAVAAWLGGLTTLLVSLYRAPSIEASAVRRFSRIALGSVSLLAATGLYQAWRQVGSWSALTGTAYGQLLLVKIGLVAVLVGIAWISRRWTTQLTDARGADAEDANTEGADAEHAEEAAHATDAAHAGEAAHAADAAHAGEAAHAADAAHAEHVETAGRDATRVAQLARQRAAIATARKKRVRDADPHRSGLRRSVFAEAGVAVVLLAVTTVLTSTEPGRTEEQAARATTAASELSGPVTLDIPFDTGGQDGKGTVSLDLAPGRTGSNEMHLYVKRPNGRPFDIPEVKVSFTLTSKDIGPLSVVPDHIVTGHWSASGVQIPMAGDWKVAVTVRTSDIDQVTVNKNVKIG
ncbi:copper resistance CopC/CopD family protein [Streptomyces himalayensis]|uniref:Protein YobA n=1 Tax=Streptomyces himalayensis subsp. himalayensis TaxID=2756131 RepID=A0A7W0DI74_9ACTN|nr:copper resistance protein CopC [Streptomyces himalayensis]MBA2945445.1 copper resistance protein CopC/CopD [Streptomyces himalayensis subsp. himalayensis]